MRKNRNHNVVHPPIRYPVAEPVLEGNEAKYINEAVRTGWVSSAGPFITEFEKEFAKFCGVRYAVSCSNGTAALHLALMALGVGPRDEVIVPSLTFIATANAVRFVGARPVFVDVEPTYWQIDPKKIERAITKRTKAIIPVHLYGHPAKMDEIMKIARAHKLFVVEDAAEALGAEVKGKKVARWGDINAFSLYGNKIITTGEGGMVVTDRKDLADKVLALRGHGMMPGTHYQHHLLGRNYRMTNLQAALGLAQLERVERLLKKKIQVARWYNHFLSGTKGITLPREAYWAKNVYWMYSVLIDPQVTGKTRDAVIAELRQYGIETRPFFYPIHQQPLYRPYNRLHFFHTEALAARGINLPSSPKLMREDVFDIATQLKRVLLS